MYDAELGLVYYNYRYYNPRDGRWTRRDPFGIEGGKDLYLFVSNSSLMFTDRVGLEIVKVKVNDTRKMYVQVGALIPSFPGGRAWKFEPGIWAISGADWTINVTCSCTKGSYHVTEVLFSFTPVVYFLQQYSSNRLYRYVNVKEQDHVADYKWWVRNEAKSLLIQAINDSEPFPSQTECETVSTNTMMNRLSLSFVTIIRRSIASWDKTGLHTFNEDTIPEDFQ